MMKNRHPQTTALKYSVLKPNQLVTSLKGTFQSIDSGGFQVAHHQGVTIRRYRLTLQSLEKYVQGCQWRLEQSGPIVRCLYLDLLTPRPASSRMTVQVYVQHIELPLSHMQGLISPEAIYLVRQALEGFRLLWERTGEVGLSDESIGLDSKGECRVWLSRSMALDYAQGTPFKKPWEIAREVIRMVQSRSQPAAHTLLARLLQKIGSMHYDFQGIEIAIANFVKNCKIKIPQNLKFLVNQHSLKQKVEKISTRISINQSKDLGRSVRIPSFLPRKNNSYEEQYFTPRFKGKKAPQRHMSVMQAATESPRRVRYHPSIYSSVRPSETNAGILVTVKKLDIPNIQVFSGSIPSKQSLQRSKSQSFESIGMINSLRPKLCSQCGNDSSIQQQTRMKRDSGYSDNSLTKVSIMTKSKLSNCSLLDVGTAKRLISRCSYAENPSNQLEDLDSQSQSQSGECSSVMIQEPTTPKLPFQLIVDEGPTFQLIPQVQQIIQANNWTTTLRNLTEHETKLNTSIVEGHDTSVYLKDVRLDKLDELTRELTQSLSSRGSQVKQ